MKTIILITLTVLLSAFTVRQPDVKTQPDPRLYDALSQAEVQEMLEKNPFLIQYYNYFLDHSYKIIAKPKSNQLDFPSVVISNMQDFNILVVKKKQKLKRNWENQTYYSIKGTDKVLVFISEREFTQKLNEHLGR